MRPASWPFSMKFSTGPWLRFLCLKGIRGMVKNEDKNKFQIEVITSDITYMKEIYCVAGWNPSGRHMKRLLINGKHWEDSDLKRIGRYASLIVTVIPAESSRDFPHLTEDIWIDEDFKVIKTYDNPKKLAEDLRLSASSTIQKAFDGKLQENSYVPAGMEGPSLGAIIIPSQNITFFKDSGKLRIRIVDNDKIEYDLRVSCKYLRDLLDNIKNLDDFNAEMQDSGSKAHVRVGLAKPYAYKDNNCYLMGNGVFFY